jgi:hypothetical protein
MPSGGPVGKVILVKYDHFMYRISSFITAL